MVFVARHNTYAHPLPCGHRFPMIKYELLPEQLLYEGTIAKANLFEPGTLSEEELLQTHESDYWNKLKNQTLSRSEERRTGFPLSEALVHRERIIMQGTVECALRAIKHGAALNIAGGTHHAYADRGEGFCLLNDLAITANHLIQNNLKKRILIIDLDVHQGNGTASIFENRKDVFTFSMHGAKNYPMKKERSNLDIGVEDGINDDDYLGLLRHHLPKIMKEFQPDFALYQCGVDVLNSDKLGRLMVSIQGCRERDRFVFDTLKAQDVPVACAMGGGYSEDIRLIVEAHSNTFRLAQEIWG